MGRRVRKREGCKRCESAKGRLVPTLRVFVVRPSRLHEQARRLHHKLFLDRHEERRPRGELPGNGPDRRVRAWSVASGSYPTPPNEWRTARSAAFGVRRFIAAFRAIGNR
jgi:hypothetical protein